MDFEVFVRSDAAAALPFCADAETDDHLRRTVFEPLRLSRPSFLQPPCCTNVRLVFPPANYSAELTSSQAKLPAQLCDDAVTPARHWRVSRMAGIPECVLVQPDQASPLDPPTSWSRAIVVDEGCAEAVLRGSDVFAAGVLASTWTYEVGEHVVVLVALSRREDPLKGSFVEPSALVASSFVVVGRGMIAMSRKSVVEASRGVAVTITMSPRHQPPSRVLQQLLPPASSATSSVFLQNYSSMVPAALLGDDLRGLRVLDACAAPGGKSSHILSRASACGALTDGSFSLVCTERSGARCKSLESLLAAHFGADAVARFVKIENVDFNQLAKRAAAQDGGEQATVSNPPREPELFDRILLDPPCTGLGLRPKLRPHAFSLTSIRNSADYQKKLLSSACKLLKSGGRLVYSTCTITIEENEEVVAFALNECKGLRLATAVSDCEKSLLRLSRGSSLVLSPASSLVFAEDALVLRFGPDSSSATSDSVGFFVAVFDFVKP